MSRIQYHPLVIQTVYAELQQICLDAEAAGEDPSGYDAVGTISAVPKTINEKVYWYAQYMDSSGKRQQSYIGPDSDASTQATIDRLQSPALAESRDCRRSMVKMLHQAGYAKMDATMEGAMLALSRTGLFRSGVTLIGTPAYQAILHQMGVSERVAIQTNDVDLSFDRLKLGIPGHIDIEKVLKEWNSKMFAVPPLNLKHGESSLKIRGKDFHVDFLTPGLYSSTGRPVHISDIRFHAETLPFLDYLLGDSQKTLLMTRYGMMAQVPEAGRFMWHKCVTAACRPSTWETKRKKDLMQARTLFEILKERDPDAIRDAYFAIKNIQEPGIFMKKLQDAMRLPEMAEMHEWTLRNGVLESARRDDENDTLSAAPLLGATLVQALLPTDTLPNEAAQMDRRAENSMLSRAIRDDGGES